jgi:hypothetical protein
MNKHAAILIMVFGIAALAGGCSSKKQDSDSATALLNAALKPIYHEVADGRAEKDIVGRKLDLTLNLKFCSEKLLLFGDTCVVVDENTKYYFIKWKVKPEVLQAIIGRRNVQCNAKGTIVEVRRGEITPGMPYVIAELESITIQ